MFGSFATLRNENPFVFFRAKLTVFRQSNAINYYNFAKIEIQNLDRIQMEQTVCNFFD